MVCNKTSIISMAFQFPYRAIICGEEHIVKSWQGRKLITSGGNYLIGHIYGDSTIHNHRLLEIAMIRSDGNDGWLVNDKPLLFLEKLPIGLRFQLSCRHYAPALLAFVSLRRFPSLLVISRRSCRYRSYSVVILQAHPKNMHILP